MSLKRPQSFLNPLADSSHIPSRTITLFRFFLFNQTENSITRFSIFSPSAKTAVHIKNSEDFLYRLNRSLIYSVELQLKRCFRDDGTNRETVEKKEKQRHREKAFSLPSVDTSTLPLVVFVVSVSIVPILILGLFLLTHKCRACSD